MVTILIIEDDPFTQQFYQFLFSKFGYKLLLTEDGDAILNILEDNDVSLIIMDINLKNTYFNTEKVDGVFLSKKIKKEPKFSSIPIILVTAYQKKAGDSNYIDESCADDYIVKPVTDYNELINKVKKLIQK